MVDPIRVVDISESAGIPPLSWFRDIQAQGVRGIIIECWNNGPVSNFHACADLAAQASLTWATYCWPPSGWQRAISYVGAKKPLFLCLDVELADGTTPAFCAVKPEHINGVRAAGFQPWVYSSFYEWSLVMNGATGFGSLAPLWVASYLTGTPHWPVPAPSSPFSGSFGGWTISLGWQCSGTTTLNGVDVDLSLFYPGAFKAAQEEDDDVTYPLPHVDWNPSGGKSYRSYYLSSRSGVTEKHLVASSEHRTALVKSGVIREPPVRCSLEELKAIPCAPGSPEPDA